jgi:hypothetical protein
VKHAFCIKICCAVACLLRRTKAAKGRKTAIPKGLFPNFLMLKTADSSAVFFFLCGFLTALSPLGV